MHGHTARRRTRVKKIAILAAALFVSTAAYSQTPATKDGAKQTPPNAATSPDRESMPKAKSKGMQKGSDMPKDETKKN